MTPPARRNIILPRSFLLGERFASCVTAAPILFRLPAGPAGFLNFSQLGDRPVCGYVETVERESSQKAPR